VDANQNTIHNSNANNKVWILSLIGFKVEGMQKLLVIIGIAPSYGF
jgi:hypothetical protein